MGEGFHSISKGIDPAIFSSHKDSLLCYSVLVLYVMLISLSES